MRREQRDRQAVKAKCGTRGVRDCAIVRLQAPGGAEVILMIVEAHARRRRFLRVHWNEELELERLLDLTDGHQLAPAPEEGVAGGEQIERKAELITQLFGLRLPALAEGERRFRRAYADVLAHAERLHPAELRRGLSAEAIGFDVDDDAGDGHVTARSNNRIDLVACGRREYEIRRRQSVDPLLSSRTTFH